MSIPPGKDMELAARQSNGHNGSELNDGGRSSPMPCKNRVLIAEDEALVAIMMEDLAVEFGWSVVGPFAKASDALAAAKSDNIDAAVLDVNLGGESVYPVADVLAARGVPFVFTTGYGAESIDRRFARTPILQKPIDRNVLEQVFSGKGMSRGSLFGDDNQEARPESQGL
jgi:CheY-like chemotaxis protein